MGRAGRVWAAAVASLAMFGVGCGGDDDSSSTATTEGATSETTAPSSGGDPAAELYAAAQSEPGLVWYSAQPEDRNAAVIEAFQEAYPDVSVEAIRLGTGALTTRYSEEQAAGSATADLAVAADAAFFETGVTEGWFDVLDDTDVPGLAEWPADLVGDAAVPVSVQPMGFGYNTDLVGEGDVPQSWEDLLDPEWEGKILLVDPRNVPVFVEFFYRLEQELGEDFLTELAGQGLTLVDSGVPGAQQLAAGEFSVMLPAAPVVVQPLTDQGAPVAHGLLEPTSSSTLLAGISAGTDSPNAARLFLHFLMSEDGQAAFNGSIGASPLGEVGDTLPMPELGDAADAASALAAKDELMSALGLQ